MASAFSNASRARSSQGVASCNALAIALWETSTAQQHKISEIHRKAKTSAQGVIELQEEISKEQKALGMLIEDTNAMVHPELDYDSDESNETQERNWDAYEKDRLKREDNTRRAQDNINLLTAKVPPIERTLKALAEECAVILCPSFAASVHASLPRELRDLVYDYLWDDLSTSRIDDQIVLPYMRHGEARHLGSWVLEVPAFADASFVGVVFASEAATWFFRHVTKAEVHIRLLFAYLAMETFGNMAFRPRDVVRRLTVDVSWEMLRYVTDDVAYAELRENLESLLTLPAKGDFEVVIYLSRDMQFSRSLFRVLEILRPIRSALVQKGVKVKILGFRFFTPQWRNPNDFREEVIPERVCTTAEQLNYYFEGTPEEWLAMKEAELQAFKQPQRKVKCLEILDNMRKHCAEVLGSTDNATT